LRLQIVAHMKELAVKENICIRHVGARERKEALVSQLIEERGDHDGIVCILSAMESCSCFKVGKNRQKGFLELEWSGGKCLHYYVYAMDPDYGLCYLRIPTWAPFRLQFYCNGHNWLERRMHTEGIGFKKTGNCFVEIGDFERARQMADSFDPEPLHRRMDELAERFVSIHSRWKDGLHWSIYQEVKHRDGTRETKYASMRKSIYSMGALAEQMQACNKRYLQFISQWRDHTKERTDLSKVTRSTKDERQNSYRGLNFFMKDDLEFMLAIMRGEHAIAGFSNRMLQRHLPGWSSQKIGRMLKRFRVLRLIKRGGRTYKYYLAVLGRKTIVAALQLKERVILPAMARA
jgi:hypothetical protein